MTVATAADYFGVGPFPIFGTCDAGEAVVQYWINEIDVIASDILFLESFRWMRKEFITRVSANASIHDDDAHATLQQEAAYQLSEFYFVLFARRLNTSGQVAILADLHNEHITRLLDDPAKMNRLGLSKSRLLDAIFTSDTLPRLIQTWEDRPGAIDQSNLARFLATTMSAETCRKTVVALTKLGFLERATNTYGSVLVISNGKLECLLGSCVRDARLRYESGGDHED